MTACSNCTLVKWWGNPTFWSPENLLLSEGICDYVKRFLVMEKWDRGRRSGVTAPTCDVVLKYTRWAARSDTWAACQISTQIASNNSIRHALQSIFPFKLFFCLPSFIFSLYFHYSVFLPAFLIVSLISFFLFDRACSAALESVSAHAVYITGFHAEFERWLFFASSCCSKRLTLE